MRKKGLQLNVRRTIQHTGFNIQSNILVSLPPLVWSLGWTPKLQLMTGTHFAPTARAWRVQPTEIRLLPGRHLQSEEISIQDLQEPIYPTPRANCGKDDIKGSNRWQTFKRQNFVRKAAVRRWCSCCPWEAKKHSLHCGCLGRSFLEDWSISERDYWKKMWDIIHWRSTLYVFLLMWHETQSNIANHGTEWKVSLSCSYSKRLKLCTSKKRKHNSPLWKTKPILSF